VKIEFLGTRGNIEPSAPSNSKHSCVLVDDKILFDIGEKEFLYRKPNYIFITHLHPDHAFFMKQGIVDFGVPIYAPEKSTRLPQLKVISGTVRAASHRVTPIPTVHSQKVKSTAYLVSTGAT
jgi:glyoxylase-like metal-dependent hydrolase (beta-lactamase superfamily II)